MSYYTTSNNTALKIAFVILSEVFVTAVSSVDASPILSYHKAKLVSLNMYKVN